MDNVEARMVGLAIQEPRYALPAAQAAGLTWDDFQDQPHKEIWKAISEMWKSGIAIDAVTLGHKLPQKQAYIEELADFTGVVDAETYTGIILEKSIKTAQAKLGQRIIKLAQSKDAGTVLSEAQQTLNTLAARHTKMKSPLIRNPADVLAQGKGWSTSTGLPFIDKLIRPTSGGMHFLAGDPGSGKTTMIVHILSHNANRGINSVGILAESSQLEVSLAMLTQHKMISAYFASQIRFNPGFRTKARIQKVRELWDENFGNLPLQVHSITEGPDEAVSLVNSITKPSVICIDHAVAVASQGQVSKDVREHQTYNQLFSSVHNAAERNDHIVIMANQYTKEGRKGETRDADAEYGGSGVRNIASSMIHLMQPCAELSTAVGYRLMYGTIPKCRAMLVADKHGVAIDPVQVTMERPFTYYINTKYRLVTDRLPTA